MIRFDPIKNRIYNDERSIKIGYRETRVLELLHKNSPDIVSKQDIIGFAWGNEFIGDTSLAKSISLLRQGFVRLGIKETPIVTVPKVGYRLIDECVVIDSSVNSATITPLVAASNLVPIGNNGIAIGATATAELKPNPKQNSPTYFPSAEGRNKLCYFTTCCLLLASALLAFAKVNERNLSDIKPINRLSEQWVGQIQVFQSPDMTMSPELKSILYQYQCDCVAYISEEAEYSELSILNKASRQSVNIFYTPTQLERASTELALFLERGQL